MSLVSTTKISENRTELIIEVKGDIFTKAVDASFRKNSKSIALPGFRKGKAPRSMVERAYGVGMFYDDAVNELYPIAYKEAVSELGLDPVDVADVEVMDLDASGFTFKAGVTTRPLATLGEYKNLSVECESVEVTQEEIDNELNSCRERYSRTSAVEGRVAKSGDISEINFEGFVDDVAFNGGKGENYSLTLGSNTFIPGFEDQIIGHSIGEDFDVNVTFPEQYGEAALAGKSAIFKVKLLELKEKVLPELDDDFAKDASEFDTMDEFLAQIKQTFTEKKEKSVKDTYENHLVEKVVEGITVEVPECMYRDRIKEMANDFGMRLSQQGLSMEDFVKYSGGSMDNLLESFKPQAEQQVKTRLALEAIAKAEAFTTNDEEVVEEYKRLSEQYNTEIDEIKKFISVKDISEDICCRKSVEFVLENSPMSTAKKPAKKAKDTAVKETKPKTAKAKDTAVKEAKPKETKPKTTKLKDTAK